MGRIARVIVPKYPHHVIQRGVRSMNVFRDDSDREAYLKYLSEQAERFKVRFLAWCLMTNHVHLVAVPREENSLARAFGEAHRRYTRMINFREKVRGHLFQERFGSCVLDERHLLAAARYVELNPVRAGMVSRPEEWPWSSARFHLGLVEKDILVKDRTLMGLAPEGGWGELLGEVDEEAQEDVRLATRTGRPAGDRKFLGRMEKKTGRDLAPGLPGRPRKIKDRRNR